MFTVISAMLFAIAQSADIHSVEELNEAIANGSNNKVGFLTGANYDSVKTLLKGVSPVVIPDSAPLEESVLNGSLIAGGTSTAPEGCKTEEFVCFSSGILTARGIMFASGLSEQRRHLINRALVIVLTNGSAVSIETRYKDNYNMQVVNVNNCPWDTSMWNITGLSADDYNFRVAGIAANWGYQGNYTKDPPTGFWPELTNAIEASINANFIHQLYPDSAGVMAAIVSGEADMTDAYWTVGGSYGNQPLVELFEWSCIVLGTDTVFFVKKSTSSGGISMVTLTSTLAGLAFFFCVAIAFFTCYIIRKEKQGKPLFMEL